MGGDKVTMDIVRVAVSVLKLILITAFFPFTAEDKALPLPYGDVSIT